MTQILKLYKVIDKLDFRDNHRELVMSYVLRLLGLLVFGILYYELYVNLNQQIQFKSLVSIEIENVSPIISMLLLVLDIVFILYLHELLHAAIFYLTNNQKPDIGINGWIIYAAAPNQVLNKRDLIINALSPFVILSTLGVVLLANSTAPIAPWIFIPTIINAAASGGDFMVVYFVLKHRKDIHYNDTGDIIYAVKYNLQENEK